MVDHRDVAAALNNLGLLYGSQRRNAEAALLLGRSIAGGELHRRLCVAIGILSVTVITANDRAITAPAAAIGWQISTAMQQALSRTNDSALE